ncbi:guanylate kinase [Sulfuricurvum sp.]|uniref:guanylate kinase n=1 Tax=Sulfuricurvum sp. TaxID=2025608 RepID=UPI0019C70CE0|nr:guanylate kinase [Sulfuricurvum sp.]MBD3799364.1 guanylate kinase [Campylobacterota bacterium]MBD3806558.1 guanylate kinase [Sulfuricurvum sp.]
MSHNSGAILVLSGPSGAGKSSLISKIVDHIGPTYFSISTTTRAMRVGEVNGVHYHFVSVEEFKREIEEEMFLEYAVVHGNYYGTSLGPVKKALKEGKLVIFDIDVQGHDAVQNRFGDITTSVFITTPTLGELKHRLHNRLTDSQDVINNRIEMAKREVQRISEYDFLVVNDNFDEAAEILISIAKAARMKIPTLQINEFIQTWETS